MMIRIFALCSLLLTLAGCGPALVGTGAAAGYSAAQERTVGKAIDDATITAKINHEFLQSPQGNLFINTDVETIEGRVYLTGQVPTPKDAVEAVRLAWKVEGVKEVNNELQVKDKTSLVDYAKDVWINSQLRSRLLLEKGVKSINYNTAVVNGIVYLMGIAQNEAELSKVVGIARRIKGVKRVISYVRMKDEPR